MKVSTDACIQGAWLPLQHSQKKALDIGAGTGLLSLMLAQRAPWLQIDALELDSAATVQAKENIAASPFAERIHAINADARDWQALHNYDLIICNPPFFSGDLAGDSVLRNSARHDDHLTAPDIARLATDLLHPEGVICMMWPAHRMDEWTRLMRHADMRCEGKLTVRNKAGARISSVISTWSRRAMNPLPEEVLFVRNEAGDYTPAFISLLQDFYLGL